MSTKIEKFVSDYCIASGIDEREFYKHFVPLPDATSPSGLSAVSNSPLAIKTHVALYWPESITPVVERQPIPDYFVQACDKFDWTPEEALRFYAEGKHYDTEDGRTRILCTGAIASYALKNGGGDYAHMKGAALSENPVMRYADSYRQMARTGTKSIDIWSVITDLERNIAPLYTAPPELAELQATIARLESKLNNAINLDFERRETIARLTAENERLNKELNK